MKSRVGAGAGAGGWADWGQWPETGAGAGAGGGAPGSGPAGGGTRAGRLESRHAKKSTIIVVINTDIDTCIYS
jgi:hypothetical protein